MLGLVLSLTTSFCENNTDNGQSVTGVAEDQQKVFCNFGDNICDGGSLILLPHLTYGQDAGEAAEFAAGL